MSEPCRSNRFQISGVGSARFDTPFGSAPYLLSLRELTHVSGVLDSRRAAVCYSSLHSGEGGNLQVGFRTLSTKVPAWRPPERPDVNSDGKSLRAVVWTSAGLSEHQKYPGPASRFFFLVAFWIETNASVLRNMFYVLTTEMPSTFFWQTEEPTCTNHFTFAYKVKSLPEFWFVAVMKCLFGWNTVAAAKTINSGNETTFQL